MVKIEYLCDDVIKIFEWLFKVNIGSCFLYRVMEYFKNRGLKIL